ncbi:uncharacterized protein [Apostichopus japonicus]|uniref:uncharacterized protein isoform X2 n=1 Tax=Stichopus japonicus TaxID=307972 RepID=UPI003AB51BAB
MKHATVTAVVFLLAITYGSADFQCPPATFVELGKDVLIDCLISDVNDIYWLRGTEEDHYPIVKIEMGLKRISKVAQDHFDITDSGALVIRDASDDLTGSYVMLHYRTNLVREVDTVTLNVTTLVDSIIIQGPSGGVYPMGSNITLTCTFQKGYVVGWKEYENKDIFVADTKVTADTKYDNFRVSLSDRISNLQIIGAELEDAGKYSCNTESYAHVEIEAPPSFRIMFNDTDDEGTDSTDSYGVIDITCIARNARPAVMIRFKTDGSEWINPSETWTVFNGVTFDTYATLKYNFRKNLTDVFLTCQTFGQKTVPPIEKIIHLFTPTCSLEMSNTEATCSCISNPPVYKYILSIDGKLEVGKTLNVENLDGSNISCTGVNYIGVGISTSRVVDSINAQPSLKIMFNVTDEEGNNSTESHGVIDITCIARNARPAVMIRFETDGSEWINPSETWTVSNGVTFDTYATLKYSFVKNQTDVFVTCQTFGQKTVPPMEKTLHLFTPNCALDLNNNEATCSCISNPPVYKYILSIDGKLEVGKTLNVENMGGSNISCTGVNYIGVGISTSRVVESINNSVNVIIIILVILGTAIALVVVHRWRKTHKSQANRKNMEDSKAATPDEQETRIGEDDDGTDYSEKSEQSETYHDRNTMEDSKAATSDEQENLIREDDDGTDYSEKSEQFKTYHGKLMKELSGYFNERQKREETKDS